jgi:hypothetical protein
MIEYGFAPILFGITGEIYLPSRAGAMTLPRLARTPDPFMTT